jgi:LPS export ABC transporter protein LptC
LRTYWTGTVTAGGVRTLNSRARRFLVLGLAVAAGGVVACRTPTPIPAARSALADSADQVMYGARFNLTDGGVLRAELEADTAYFFDDNTRIELDRVRSIFFTQVGVKDAVLTSQHGRYNTRFGDMVAYGDVVVINEAGRRLVTPELQYNQARNEFYSDSAFTMTEPGRELRGIGFRSDPNLNNVRVLRAASGFVSGDGGGSAVPPPPAEIEP